MNDTAGDKRGSPRVRGLETVQVEINDNVYNIFDMGPKGIGFLLQDTADFYEGKITHLRLITDKETYHLRGEVVHLSQALHLPSGGIYLCGVQLIFDSDEHRKEIEEYIKRESLT
jgi:hypothetical protein